MKKILKTLVLVAVIFAQSNFIVLAEDVVQETNPVIPEVVVNEDKSSEEVEIDIPTPEEAVGESVVEEDVQEIVEQEGEEKQELEIEPKLEIEQTPQNLVIPNQVEEEVVASTTINLYVLTKENVLFKEKLNFEKCSSFEGQDADFFGYCALEEAGLNPLWQIYGEDTFLSSLSGIENAPDFNPYWSYFKNRNEGQVALNKDVFTDGDELLVTLGAQPIYLATTTLPVLNATSTIKASYFGYDENYSLKSFNLEDSEIYLDDQLVGTTTSLGLFDFLATTTGTFIFEAKKIGFADSLPFEVSFVEEQEDTDENTGGGNSGGDVEQKNLNTDSLLSFLDSKQEENGSFGSDLYTDWAGIAYGASKGHNESRTKLKTFLISDNLQGSSITDYERRAMALMALGINPYTGGKENYIQKIIDSFDGTQFGDSDLINDDIFAILVLKNAGFSQDEDMIKKATSFIISKQNGNGSFESPDLTSATVQALLLSEQNDVRDVSVQKAVSYLKGLQQTNGGFDNSFATSWIILALKASGEDVDSLEINNKNPIDYLADLQQTDGGLESLDTQEEERVWTTSYAVPVALNKIWDSILNDFNKVVSEDDQSNDTGNENVIENIVTLENTATSTLPIIPTVLGASIIAGEDSVVQKPVVPNQNNDENLNDVSIEEESPVTLDPDPQTETKTPNKTLYTIVFGVLVILVTILKWKKSQIS